MYDSIFNTQDMISLQNILRKRKQTITTAESCTGGLVSYLITKISGSSDIFKGASITYSNEIKNQELNVKNTTLKSYGAVSIEVVKEMLSFVRTKYKADYAIAISGIAGPNGATKDKPVGTVVIGIIGPKDESLVEIHHFIGTRNEVQIQAAKTALKRILKFL